MGLLIAGGVLGAVGASALATCAAPAPAKALDACVSVLGADLGIGSAHCASSGLDVAIAIGADATAAATGGMLGNAALALGANSDATTAPNTSASYFDVATALAGGYAQASDGVFEIASAFGPQPNASAGALATYGAFGLARALGTNAEAETGGDSTHFSTFEIARALGNNSTAFAQFGFVDLARAVGKNSDAEAYLGNFEIARDIELGSGVSGPGGAHAGNGNFNIARALGIGAQAGAGGSNSARGSFNIARSVGNNSYAGAGSSGPDFGSFNIAHVIGKTSSGTAGPGNFHHVLVVGNNKTAHKP